MSTDQARQGMDRRALGSLLAICTAAGLVWLAFADFGVAIPTIADELDADLSGLQWANNAFSLVTGALVIAAGKFGDVFGRRRMLVVGTALFAGFSVVAALSQGVPGLILGRGLMGIGAALILPATLALIAADFSGKALLTAFGVWQAVAWGGQAVGPAIGGILTETLGWAWLFWLNVPLGILALVLIRALTPESNDPKASRHVDLPGLITIGLAVFALLFALTEGPAEGWTNPIVLGMLFGAVILAVSWIVIERRVKEPLVDLSLFRLRPYDGALTANLLMNLAFGGLSYLLVLWLQNARGYDAVQAGLLMLPSTLGIFLLIPVGGRLASSRGNRLPVLAGLLILGAGLIVLGFMGADSSFALMAAGLIVVGIGLGLLSTPISNTAVGGVSVELAGTAAGVFKMSSMVGGALGVALLAAIARAFTLSGAQGAMESAGMTPEQISQAHQALVASDSFAAALATLSAELASMVTNAAIVAFSDGVARSMTITALLVFGATLIVAYVWPRGQEPKSGAAQTEN